MLVVGDSLEVGTGPHLEQELGGLQLTLDAVIGRASPEGVEALAALIRPQHRVVVFDLGTNDDFANPAKLQASLGEARRIAGSRCMVVATIHSPPVNGVTSEGVNRVVRRFAATSGPVQVADWQAQVGADPSLIAPDGLHGSASGYRARAKLVAGAVRACLGAGGSTGLPAPRGDVRPPPRDEPEPPPPPRRVKRFAIMKARPLGPLRRYAGGALDALGSAVDGARSAVGTRPEPTL